jgi:integrase
VVSLRDPTTKTGRRVKWHPGHDTKKAAQQALTKILSGLDEGTYVEPSKKTLGAFLGEDWLPAVRATVEPGTFATYEGQVKAHLIPRLGAIPLQQLRAPRLNATYAELLERGRKDGRGGLSPRSVQYLHTILDMALAAAVEWNFIPRNPADAAKLPKQVKRQLKTWTADELRRFLAHVREHRLYAAFLLLATTGMRRGEVLGLHWSDVDLDAGRLAITRTWIAPNGKQQEGTPKTKRSNRPISLDAGTVAALREHRERQQLEAAFLSVDEFEVVFAREDGAHLDPHAFSELFQRQAEAAGCPRIELRQSGTPTRRSRFGRACTRRSSPSASATRRSRSRWTSTAMPCRCSRSRPPSSSPR